MATVEFGVSQSRAGKRAPRRILIAAALTAIGLCASACSMIDQFNPFGTEKYKMEIVPDTPASKTYNQGLEKLANGSPSEAAKKFTELGKQYPGSDWARKGSADDDLRRLPGRQAIPTRKPRPSAFSRNIRTSPDAAYVTYLRANAYYQQIPDISRDQDTATKAMEAFQDLVKKYPKVGICRGCEVQNPGDRRTNSPARKCRSAGSI